MDKQDILLRKKRMVLVPLVKGQADATDPRGLTLQAEVMRLGFLMEQPLLEQLSLLSDDRFEKLYTQVLRTLRNLVGDDVKYKPMYPNFPKQVMDASLAELYTNAILHYWTWGIWKPEYAGDPRLAGFEKVKFKVLRLGRESDVPTLLAEILGSNASVTDKDKEIVEFLMKSYPEAELVKAMPKDIPFKENLCTFVANCLEKKLSVLGMSSLKTATDILRVATHLSGGDVSLAANTKFKSFSRERRRLLVTRLNEIINDDDVFRHRSKWMRLAHSLHVGDYSKVAPKAFEVISRVRDGDFKYVSFDAKTERWIVEANVSALITHLSQRPGMFARRLDHLVRSFGKNARTANRIINAFLGVADRVDTRVLMQLFGHFKSRANDISQRLVFPKGSAAKATLVKTPLSALPEKRVDSLLDGIKTVLEARFAKLPALGKCFIDPRLGECPVPLSLRSASDGLEVVGRGTRFDLGEKNTLRLFIYWKGEDIDLSATAIKADFTPMYDIAYYNLKEGEGCHSGDITHAPNGAAEFIDLDIKKMLDKGVRYIAMQVHIFRGPDFADHEVCYAGWMTRDKPNKNEIYDPKTVEQKITLTAQGKTAVPVIFDLVERKAIWMDALVPDSSWRNIGSLVVTNRGKVNNAMSTRASVMDILKGSLDLSNKPTLHDLFTMHAKARGKLVKQIEKAETVFSVDQGVKPSSTTEILSKYLV